MPSPRNLRLNATDAEKSLWSLLRNRQLDGKKFRRQQPIGPYVVDFVCLDCRLIVEADGGQHTPERDAARTRWLESQGFQVLRFWNNEVLGNPSGVATAIMAALSEAPSPRPSLAGGEGAT